MFDNASSKNKSIKYAIDATSVYVCVKTTTINIVPTDWRWSSG